MRKSIKELALIRATRDGSCAQIQIKGKTVDVVTTISFALVEMEKNLPQNEQAAFRASFMEQLNAARRLKVKGVM